jgi:hypothetical protein
MWPLIATFFNFPPWMRYKLPITTLLGVQAGWSKKRHFSLQPVLQVLMDELQLLDYGVDVFDANKQETVRIRAKLVRVSAMHSSQCIQLFVRWCSANSSDTE